MEQERQKRCRWGTGQEKREGNRREGEEEGAPEPEETNGEKRSLFA